MQSSLTHARRNSYCRINTAGGNFDDQSEMLKKRRADIISFVNYRNGSLVAIAQTGNTSPFGFLPAELKFTSDQFTDVTTTDDMLLMNSKADSGNMDHCCFHGFFTGPEGWNNLRVLAHKVNECPVPYSYRDPNTGVVYRQKCKATHLVTFAACLKRLDEDCFDGEAAVWMCE